MNLLIIGSGAREHAIVQKFSKNPLVEKIYAAPGNDGMEPHVQCIELTSIRDMIQFAQLQDIDFTFVGPEQPLAQGIVDAFTAADLDIIGPTKAAAELESSKLFAKKFMAKYGIPTASFETFNRIVPALEFVLSHSCPVVIKTDGLAAGKGVFICKNPTEAEIVLNNLMHYDALGTAGHTVVIEEFLEGEETSLFAISDGEHFTTTILSQDHKRLLDNDEGPNTGGMGAYAPAVFSPTLKNQIDKEIIAPTLNAIKKEGRPFVGILYAGIMVTPQGPRVLEYNCRLGDPETQAILPLLDTDLVDICKAIIDKKVDTLELQWKAKHAVTIVLASDGYPRSYEKGFPVTVENLDTNAIITYAGVRKERGHLVTNGGRVLSVTALGDTLLHAKEAAYKAVTAVHFENMIYRNDIAEKGIRKLNS